MEFSTPISRTGQGRVNHAGPTVNNNAQVQLDGESIDTNPKAKLEEAHKLHSNGGRRETWNIYESFRDKIAELRAMARRTTPINLKTWSLITLLDAI
jgi:hypothetical protein